MAHYRIYTLDAAGHVRIGMDADCESDERAFAWAATTLGDDVRTEIWQGTRCLGRVSAEITPLDDASSPSAFEKTG
jgi:hypothetical protein